MSLWDLYDQNDIHSLISNTDSPDFDAILGHSELFQLFRENDEDLMNFLNNQQVFLKILNIMTKNKDTKIPKRIVELFLFKDSVLLKNLFTLNDMKIVNDLIQSIDSTNNNETISLLKEDRLVRIGYISRIFIHSLTIPAYKEKILSLFSSSPNILTLLTKNAEITSIFDLLQAYLNLLKPEEQWILFAYLQILLPKGKSASCPKCFIQYKNLIINIIKEMTAVAPLNSQTRINLLRLISNSIKESIENSKNANTDVINSVSTNLAFIFNSTDSNEELKVLIFRLAMVIPPERSLLNLAASLIKNSNSSQINSVNIAALDLLSVSPSKTLSILLPTIIKNFISDKTNSFHHLSFLNFIKNAIEKVPEMRGPIAKEMLPLILSESSGNEKWRKNASRVAFFLEIGDLIDQYVDELASSGTVDKSTFSSWKTFRGADLKKWKLKDTEKVDAPEAVAMSSYEQKEKSPAAAAAAEEEAALSKAKQKTSEKSDLIEAKSGENNGGFDAAFPSADSFPKEEKKDSGFGGFDASFPSTDSFPKEEKKDDGGFGGFDASFPSTDSFPKEEKKDDGGFGGFDAAFPTTDSFPKEDDKKEGNGFGGFGFGDSFPAADSFPKDDKEEGGGDRGFGGFDAAFPTTDSFPKDDDKKEDGGFGGFGAAFPTTDDDKKEGNGFGGFDAAFPTTDSFPKDDKKEDAKEKGFGGFDAAFPTTDSFPKDDKEAGNGFPTADAFPKEEKTEGGFGGFGAAEDQKEDGSKKQEEGKKEPDAAAEEEDDDDDSDFEDLSAQQAQAAEQRPVKPAPMPVFTQTKPVSNEPVDVSFSHFLELIDNPCWTYTGPTPAELFGQKEAYSTAEEAFNFLVGKST